MVMCHYNSMADILAAAFRSEKKTKDFAAGHDSAEAAIASFNQLLAFG